MNDGNEMSNAIEKKLIFIGLDLTSGSGIV